jgi:xylose dehydrogenase (NAD/NADP)
MRLALIGASSIADKIFPAMSRVTSFEIAGVSSQDELRGRTFASRHDIPYLGLHETALTHPDIQAVYISTTNKTHERLIELALLNGKHVLCEKPLVLTGGAAIRLFGIAKERGLVLLEGFVYRFHPQIVEMLRRIQSGSYGLVKRIHASFCFDYGEGDPVTRRWSGGGGALPDLGSYLIDFMNLVAGGAEVHRVLHTEELTPRSFAVAMQLSNGVLVQLRAAMNLPSINTWEVICERGALSVNRFNPHESAESTLRVVDDESRLTSFTIASDGTGMEQFVAEFENFRSVIRGDASPFITAEQSIRNARVLERIGSD